MGQEGRRAVDAAVVLPKAAGPFPLTSQRVRKAEALASAFQGNEGRDKRTSRHNTRRLHRRGLQVRLAHNQRGRLAPVMERQS